MSDFEPKVGIHYYVLNDYFTCLKCHRAFSKQYSVKQKKRKEYGTKQLMALWAWYNFERHLKACWKPCTPIPKEEK